MDDLQPYVCTHTNCSLPNRLFEDRDTWFRHETQHHRVEFFCNTPGHQVYVQQADFATHMKQEHDTTLTSSSPLLDIFRRPLQGHGGVCNLCFRETENLKIHVSRHLQQLALFALPRADYSADDEILEGDPNISQNNARGSGSQERQGTASRSSESISEATGDQAPVTQKTAADNYEAYSEEPVEQVEIPVTAESTERK